MSKVSKPQIQILIVLIIKGIVLSTVRLATVQHLITTTSLNLVLV